MGNMEINFIFGFELPLVSSHGLISLKNCIFELTNT